MSSYDEMALALVAGTLSPEGFDHRAHVAVGHAILSKHDVFEAAALFANGLRKVTRAAGVPEKFNATVTFAFISLIAARMIGHEGEGAEAFLERNPDLLDMALLDRLFPAGEWRSDLGRRVPLLPAQAMVAAPVSRQRQAAG